MAATRRTSNDSLPPQLVDDGSSRLLLATAQVAWDDATVLGALSLLLLVVFAPFVVLASVVGWLAVWAPMVLLTAPVWFATVVASDRLLDGRGVSLREVPRSIRRGARTAWCIGLAPAAAGFVVLGVLELLARDPNATGPRVAVAPALGMLAAVAVLAGPTFAAAARYDIDAGTAWRLGARIVVARPLQQIGLVLCFAIVLWLTVVVGPVMLLAVAPFALLSVAVARVPDNEIRRTHDDGPKR